jgi:transposase
VAGSNHGQPERARTMRTFTISDEDLATLRDQRLHHPHPRIRRKLEVLWLFAKGESQQEVVRLTELGRATVHRYLTQFLQGGLDAVLELRFRRPSSELDDHAAALKAHFAQHPPRSTREAQQVIAEQTGLHRGLTQVRRFLKKNSS